MVRVVVHREFGLVAGEFVRQWSWSVYVNGRVRGVSETTYMRKKDAMRGAQRFIFSIRAMDLKFEIDED